MTASTSAASSAPVARPSTVSSDRRKRRLLDRCAPRTARDAAIQPGTQTVPCPYEPGRYITATVNRKVDVLADERARGRITEAEYLVGRMIQAVYERGSGARLGSAGWDVCGSRDQTVAHELAIIYAVEDAERVRRFTARLEREVGGAGARFLRAVLAEGGGYRGYLAQTGKTQTERAIGDVAKRLRWMLAELTEAQHTATGSERQLIRGTRVVVRRRD